MDPESTKLLFPASGGPTKKRSFPRKLQKTIPDSVVTLFPFRDPFAVGPARGPAGLACCLLLAAARLLLLDVQDPSKWPNNWINRLKYYVLQLGDPSPNQDFVLGPS